MSSIVDDVNSVSAASNKGPLTGVPATSKGPPAGWFRHE